jgi:hypothetical protein
MFYQTINGINFISQRTIRQISRTLFRKSNILIRNIKKITTLKIL